VAVFPIVVPPLRARAEDIVPLAEHLLTELAAAAGQPAPTLADATKARLRAAPWPGNVRQLRNALERAMILSDGPVLGPDLFAPAASPEPARDDHSLEQLERRAIEAALAAVSGNRRAAAQRLGIGLRTLYEKLKRYDVR
jgi:DNA-binding NtrC family response regulator